MFVLCGALNKKHPERSPDPELSSMRFYRNLQQIHDKNQQAGQSPASSPQRTSGLSSIPPNVASTLVKLSFLKDLVLHLLPSGEIPRPDAHSSRSTYRLTNLRD
mmetsp:Transcript_872/g.1315  ORF Transcript_872/g.1315 Transcript_872/m.1315 type:complete len:104 (+) Transcript_872:354-665(+)